MRRAVAPLALAIAMTAQPATAMAVRMASNRLPDLGRFELNVFGMYAPYELTVQKGAVYAINPTSDGYHDFRLSTTLEAGVAPETSLTLSLPSLMTKKFDSTPAARGLDNLDLGICRRTYSNETFSWKSRVHAILPTGSSQMGGGVAALGLDNVFTLSLARNTLMLNANANYLYRLRTTQVDPVTNLFTSEWKGQHAELNLGIEVRPLPEFALVIEALSHWDSGREANRQQVLESGGAFVAVAPGFSLNVLPHVSWLGSLSIPLLRTGYQLSYRLEGMTGVVIEF